MAKRGRPPLAAKSLDEALRAVKDNTAPKRPRNDVERIAAGRRRGRPPSAGSSTHMAAQLASYHMQQEGLPQAEAVRRACAASTPAADPSNVRKYLKRMHPTVLCRHNGGGLFPGFPSPQQERRLLLASVEDVFASDRAERRPAE